MDASNNGIKFDCVGNFGCVGTRKGWIDHFLKPGMPFYGKSLKFINV